MSKKSLFFAAVVAITLARPAARQAAEKITIMVGGIDKIIYLPAKLTEQLGYFKDEGLDVELLSEPAGVDAENELLAGAVQGVVGFYDHTIDLQSKGKFVEIGRPVQPGAGRSRTGLDQGGRPDQVAGRFQGQDARRDRPRLVDQLPHAVPRGQERRAARATSPRVPVGAGNTFIAAMKQDQIQAGMTTEPTISRLLKTGDAKVLVDMRTRRTPRAALGGIYPAASFYVQTAWVESHKDEAQKLANAFVKTLKFIAHAQRRGDRRQDAEGLLRQRQGPVRQGAGRRAADVHDRRQDAGRRPGDGAEGAADLQQAA